MLENGRIGISQLVLLFITSRIILNITYFPASKSPPANQDLWLAQLVSIPATILLAVPIMVLAAKYPQQTIIDYSRTIAGKVAGKVLGLLFIWFFLNEGATALRPKPSCAARRFGRNLPTLCGRGYRNVYSRTLAEGVPWFFPRTNS